MSNFSRRALLALSLALALTGCRESDRKQESGGTGEKALTPLKVGYSRLRISLPVFVAQERGLFEKHGLDVDLVSYDTAQPLMQALVEDEVQVAGYTALPITYNGMLRSGRSLLFVTALVEDQEHRLSYLLKRKNASDSQPTLENVADLKGKRIGILPTVAYRAWLLAILKASGVASEDVVIQQVAPSLQIQALQSGGVDALFTNDPAATSALESGVAEFLSHEVDVPKALGEPFIFGSFNVSKEWAEANPETYQRLVAALDEAVEYVNDNQEDAKLTMRPYMADAFKPHVAKYPNARYLTTDDTSEALFVDNAASQVQMGIIDRALDLSGLVETSSGGAG